MFKKTNTRVQFKNIYFNRSRDHFTIKYRVKYDNLIYLHAITIDNKTFGRLFREL